MLNLNQKPYWLSEGLWRALRTVAQLFLAALGATLLVVLTGYQQTHIFDATTLYFDGVVGGLIAVVAWLMNRK
ncbi:MAG: hypothetical protein WC700_14290 [Gemmatimonadaceae bacterium]|jgi:hypothetical protein